MARNDMQSEVGRPHINLNNQNLVDGGDKDQEIQNMRDILSSQTPFAIASRKTNRTNRSNVTNATNQITNQINNLNNAYNMSPHPPDSFHNSTINTNQHHMINGKPAAFAGFAQQKDGLLNKLKQ